MMTGPMPKRPYWLAPVLLAACQAGPVDTPANAQPAEPAPANTAAPQGEALGRQITLSNGEQVTIEPFRELQSEGLSDSRCGVVIAGARIVTLGSGDTDTYNCYALVDAGPLPGERIGLIYDSGSRNASFRTAVILQRSNGGWSVDADRLGTFDDTPAAQSISALAAAVR